MTPGETESLRLAHYEALVALAERHGFGREDVGVSVSAMQEPGSGKVSLDMQMPPELAHLLRGKGFFKEGP
jgi:hypothetical protein